MLQKGLVFLLRKRKERQGSTGATRARTFKDKGPRQPTARCRQPTAQCLQPTTHSPMPTAHSPQPIL